MATMQNDINFYSFKRWGKSSNSAGCVEYTFKNCNNFNKNTTATMRILLCVILGLLLCGQCFSNIIFKWMILPTVFITLVFVAVKCTCCVKKEALYVIAPIGIQFVSTYASGTQSVLFIPWHSFKNIVIVEMIIGQGIYFYLAIQSKPQSGSKLVVLFEHTRPRLSHLEEMYRVITDCISSKRINQ